MVIHSIILILSVLIGSSLVWVINQKKTQWLKIMLSFCGGYLLSICMADIMPVLYENQDVAGQVGWFVIVGFLLQLFLDFLSGGIEHGHFHHSHEDRTGKVPYTVLIGLLIHAFFEGLPLSNQLGDHTLSTLVWGIALHNLPVSIVLLTLLFERKIKSSTISIIVIVFALATPLGMLCSSYFFGSEDLSAYQYYALAIVVGIFLHISTTILFETDKNHRYNFMKISVIVAGILLAGLMHI